MATVKPTYEELAARLAVLETAIKTSDDNDWPAEPALAALPDHTLQNSGHGTLVDYHAGEDQLTASPATWELAQKIADLAAKNSELERFAYIVSHDLRNPMVTIRGFVDLLEKDALAGDVERMERDRHLINEAVDKMESLLNDLLKLSRIGRVVSEPFEVPLDDIIHEVLRLMTGTLLANDVQVEVAGDLPTIRCDRRRIAQVFQNLIDNAIKFTGEQGPPRIEIGVREELGETICYVHDRGVGIDPRYHDKVFGLFNRLSPSKGGTGIGLTLVRRIIESHGGRVWVESEGKDRGCTVCFTTESKQGY